MHVSHYGYKCWRKSQRGLCYNRCAALDEVFLSYVELNVNLATIMLSVGRVSPNPYCSLVSNSFSDNQRNQCIFNILTVFHSHVL